MQDWQSSDRRTHSVSVGQLTISYLVFEKTFWKKSKNFEKSVDK